jgi:hypothetical protein
MENLETGDIILFSTNRWYSDVIEYADDTLFSHCGIVLVNPTYIDASLNGIYLLESGVEPFPDSTDNKYHFGVQIVPLIKVINEYVLRKAGNLYHRKLVCNRDKSFERNLVRAYGIVKDKPYNCDPIDWIEALFGIHWFDRQITSRFWCSALVAYIYVQLKIVDSNIDWTLVTPREWGSNQVSNFVFLNGSYLQKEIRMLKM